MTPPPQHLLNTSRKERHVSDGNSYRFIFPGKHSAPVHLFAAEKDLFSPLFRYFSVKFSPIQWVQSMEVPAAMFKGT